MSDGGLIVTPPRLAPTSFNVADYGARSNGVHDDTAAFAIAYALAAAEPNGGNIILPYGRTRITSFRLLDNSNSDLQPSPVFIVGQNKYPSVLWWDPADLTEDVIHYRAASGGAYFGGGIQNIAIVAANPLASGKAIRITQGFDMRFTDVWVRGFGGVGGTGFLVEGGATLGDTSQHIDLERVNLQGNAIGLDAIGVVEMSMRKLLLNQNTTAAGVIRGGTFCWEAGLIQGSASLEFRPEAIRSISFASTGVHHEVLGVPTIKAYPPPGDVYAGQISISNCPDNGDNTFLDADRYTLRLDNIGSFSALFAKIRNGAVTAIDCSAFAAKWDLDASSLESSTFTNSGHTSYGKLPTAPTLVPLSASFGLPVELASLTQTQRDALTDVADGWTFFNASARRGQQYVAGRAKPWVCLAPENALEIWPALMHHFSSIRGVSPSSGQWADMIGDFVFTATGAPPCEADGKHFNGLNAWKLTLAGSQLLDTGGAGTTIFPIGATEFYVRLIARQSAPLPGSFGTYLDLTNNAANIILGQVLDHATDGAWEGAFEGGRTNFGPPLVQDALPHKFELYFSPGSQEFLIDGVQIANAGPATPLTQPVQRITLGGFPGFGFYSNVNIVDLKIGPTRPTGDTAAALDEMDFNLYGVG